MSEIRLRFAPSPTGYLHIGGVRTALFNWLFARHHGGKFFLRIEDTDRARSTKEATEAITDGLTWLGLNWDPWQNNKDNLLLQTDRLEIYRSKAEQLLSKDLAYRCICLPEELEKRRKEALAQRRPPRYDGRCRSLKSIPSGSPYVIRFRNNENDHTVVQDLVKGPITFDHSNLDDLILLRSDGTPTYNLSVVIDDGEMEISHVIRGDDHLNNTPKQIQLFKAFQFKIPQFAHLSMILGSDRSRLSKRHGATAIQWYRQEGYLPEALLNYLARLGWSHKDQEIFTIEEMIDKFSLDKVGSSAAVFNPDKLLWLNAHYIKTNKSQSLADPLSTLVSQTLNLPLDHIRKNPLLDSIIIALQERSRTLKEMADSAICFFQEPVLEEAAREKFLTSDTLPILESLHRKFQNTPSFSHDHLEPAFKEVMSEFAIKMAKVAQPLRVVLTGKTVSPGIYDVLELIGKEKTLVRLKKAINLIKTESPE